MNDMRMQIAVRYFLILCCVFMFNACVNHNVFIEILPHELFQVDETCFGSISNTQHLQRGEYIYYFTELLSKGDRMDSKNYYAYYIKIDNKWNMSGKCHFQQVIDEKTTLSCDRLMDSDQAKDFMLLIDKSELFNLNLLQRPNYIVGMTGSRFFILAEEFSYNSYKSTERDPYMSLPMKNIVNYLHAQFAGSDALH